MLTDDEWGQWVKHHSTLFWMTSEHDAALFSAWREVLAEFSFDELRHASLEIAKSDDSARFRTEHLDLIRKHIQVRRKAVSAAEDAELDRVAAAIRCRECAGDGLVVVPHPQCITNGVWGHPFAVLAVACRCNKGQTLFNRLNSALAEKKRRFRMEEIARYEAMHPDWQQMLAGRNAQREAEAKAGWHAAEGDRNAPISLDAVKKKLAEAFKEKT